MLWSAMLSAWPGGLLAVHHRIPITRAFQGAATTGLWKKPHDAISKLPSQTSRTHVDWHLGERPNRQTFDSAPRDEPPSQPRLRQQQVGRVKGRGQHVLQRAGRDDGQRGAH